MSTLTVPPRAAPRRYRRAAELSLARYARTRDPEERAGLVRRYMPLARRLAARYSHVVESREDLVQVATIGLILAIDRYDPSRGTAFTSFAVPTILGELRRHLRDHSWAVHVPRDTRELAHRLPAVADDLASRLGRPATAAELAERLGRSVEQIRDARAALACRTAVSLDHAIGDHGERLADILDGGDGGVTEAENRVVVEELIAALPVRLRAIVLLRFRADLTQREIGQLLSLSQAHVGRLLNQSLRALRPRTGPGTVSR